MVIFEFLYNSCSKALRQEPAKIQIPGDRVLSCFIMCDSISYEYPRFRHPYCNNNNNNAFT